MHTGEGRCSTLILIYATGNLYLGKGLDAAYHMKSRSMLLLARSLIFVMPRLSSDNSRHSFYPKVNIKSSFFRSFFEPLPCKLTYNEGITSEIIPSIPIFNPRQGYFLSYSQRLTLQRILAAPQRKSPDSSPLAHSVPMPPIRVGVRASPQHPTDPLSPSVPIPQIRVGDLLTQPGVFYTPFSQI